MASFKYAFTVTLKSKFYKLTPAEQYDMSYNRLYHLLQVISMPGCLTMVAELTKSCNIHYHGVIIMFLHKKSCRIRFHNLFRREEYFGFVNLTQITDEKNWIEYISKDFVKTKEDLDRPPIICDEFKIILHPTCGFSQIWI